MDLNPTVWQPALGFGRINPGWIPASSAKTAFSSKADLNVFAKAFEEGLDGSEIAEALSRREVERQDDFLELGFLLNGHHERLKTFVNRQARGVSTRYLHLYAAWPP